MTCGERRRFDFAWEKRGGFRINMRCDFDKSSSDNVTFVSVILSKGDAETRNVRGLEAFLASNIDVDKTRISPPHLQLSSPTSPATPAAVSLEEVPARDRIAVLKPHPRTLLQPDSPSCLRACTVESSTPSARLAFIDFSVGANPLWTLPTVDLKALL